MISIWLLLIHVCNICNLIVGDAAEFRAQLYTGELMFQKPLSLCHSGNPVEFPKKQMSDEMGQNEKEWSFRFHRLTVFFIFRAVFIWTIIIILKVVGWFLIIEHMTHRAYWHLRVDPRKSRICNARKCYYNLSLKDNIVLRIERTEFGFLNSIAS